MNPSPTRTGFSLIESLIASVILAIAVVALVTPLSLSAEKQRTAALQTTGAALASQMMERLLTLDAQTVLASDGLEQQGREITDYQGQRIDDASVEGFPLRLDARAGTLPAGGESFEEADTFVIAKVTVTHEDTLPVELTRLIAP